MVVTGVDTVHPLASMEVTVTVLEVVVEHTVTPFENVQFAGVGGSATADGASAANSPATSPAQQTLRNSGSFRDPDPS